MKDTIATALIIAALGVACSGGDEVDVETVKEMQEIKRGMPGSVVMPEEPEPRVAPAGELQQVELMMVYMTIDDIYVDECPYLKRAHEHADEEMIVLDVRVKNDTDQFWSIERQLYLNAPDNQELSTFGFFGREGGRKSGLHNLPQGVAPMSVHEDYMCVPLTGMGMSDAYVGNPPEDFFGWEITFINRDLPSDEVIWRVE